MSLATGLRALAEPASTAEDPLEGDLRDLRVGMAVDQLPAEGYVDLACGSNGGEPGAAPASWGQRPLPDAAGLHEVTLFAYERSPSSATAGRAPKSPAIR